MLENLCDMIHSGDVTVDKVKKIELHQIQMSKLCEAIYLPKKLTEVHESIKLRLDEVEFFTEYKNKLEYFLVQVGSILRGM
jgi:hypothetical protein